MVVLRDGVMYYAQTGEAAAVAEWERLLSSVDPLVCPVCSKAVRTSHNMVKCGQCHASLCDDCSWKRPSSECSFCGNFDIRSYMKKRARCAKVIFSHHGFSPRDVERFKAGRSLCVLREGAEDKPLDDYIDEMLKALGDKLYMVRSELHAYID